MGEEKVKNKKSLIKYRELKLIFYSDIFQHMMQKGYLKRSGNYIENTSNFLRNAFLEFQSADSENEEQKARCMIMA